MTNQISLLYDTLFAVWSAHSLENKYLLAQDLTYQYSDIDQQTHWSFQLLPLMINHDSFLINIFVRTLELRNILQFEQGSALLIYR
jgi:hypothetical protein